MKNKKLQSRCILHQEFGFLYLISGCRQIPVLKAGSFVPGDSADEVKRRICLQDYEDNYCQLYVQLYIPVQMPMPRAVGGCVPVCSYCTLPREPVQRVPGMTSVVQNEQDEGRKIEQDFSNNVITEAEFNQVQPRTYQPVWYHMLYRTNAQNSSQSSTALGLWYWAISMRSLCDVRYRCSVCYAMSGTDVGYNGGRRKSWS
eukprot:866804-Rhodomonas_salina.3